MKFAGESPAKGALVASLVLGPPALFGTIAAINGVEKVKPTHELRVVVPFTEQQVTCVGGQAVRFTLDRGKTVIVRDGIKCERESDP